MPRDQATNQGETSDVNSWGGWAQASCRCNSQTRQVAAAAEALPPQPQEFAGDVRALFSALDVNEQGFIVRDELEFLTRWEGERFAKVVASFVHARCKDLKGKEWVHQ